MVQVLVEVVLGVEPIKLVVLLKANLASVVLPSRIVGQAAIKHQMRTGVIPGMTEDGAEVTVVTMSICAHNPRCQCHTTPALLHLIYV